MQQIDQPEQVGPVIVPPALIVQYARTSEEPFKVPPPLVLHLGQDRAEIVQQLLPFGIPVGVQLLEAGYQLLARAGGSLIFRELPERISRRMSPRLQRFKVGLGPRDQLVSRGL